MPQIKKIAVSLAVIFALAILLYNYELQNAVDVQEIKTDVPSIATVDLSSDSNLLETQKQSPPVARELNPAFKEIDAAVLDRIAPAINAKYFQKGNPEQYIRHEIFEIDTGNFKNQLERSWMEWDENQLHTPISIPLFTDVTVEAAIKSWRGSPLGVSIARGTVDGSDSPTAYAVFRIADDGEMNGNINIRGGGYFIAMAGEQPYYIVMELGPPDWNID